MDFHPLRNGLMSYAQWFCIKLDTQDLGQEKNNESIYLLYILIVFYTQFIIIYYYYSYLLPHLKVQTLLFVLHH